MSRVKSVLIICGLMLLLVATSGAAAAAPLAGAAQSPAAGMAGSTYVVQWGENLSSIAWRVYGNSNAWACIWRANSWIANPNYLQAGWRIVLPASCSSGGGGPAPAPRYHMVHFGETLSGIACYYYADCNYWRIYNANRDRIWNVNYVPAGLVLRIP